ncbi:MAG: PDZ domain-containing protein [Planctomycetales bacterium]|nr:PDZ domain-containing protein [Planctomycetales bacterium]
MWLIVASSAAAGAANFYVDPAGADAQPGSSEKPFQTLTRAQAAVRQSPQRGKQPLTVFLRQGTYYLADTLVFTPQDSGTVDAPVTWSAHPGEQVVISGGAKLKLSWRPYRAGIFQAETPAGMQIDQLFINGQRQHMARYPNFDPKVAVYNGYAADAFSPPRAARWADPAGGYIHAMHKHRWGGYHYRITGKKPDHTVTYEGGWQNNRQMGMHNQHRFVENIFEELDAPGEWYHNAQTQTLYYFPAEGIDLPAATVEVSRLRQLVAFRGDQQDPVRHLNLSGLVFRHAARTFMDTKEPLLRSDWTIYRGGAVMVTGAEDCAIADCQFDQVGGNALFVNNYNRRIAVRGTHIHGAGASGVCFVGDPQSVRNPLFEYNQRQSYHAIDRTPGPQTENYPADCVVEDCLIHDIGVVEKQAAGIQISMSRRITVRHCSIYDIGRAGINISEGTFGGHLIEFCDVFDTVRETSDHGSFNSWGRDRFWKLRDAAPKKLPELALLDTEKTVIRNSRWRCDHGWDVDLDDGSSNYQIYNNLFLRGGLKLREGFHRQVYNNIAINNGLHPHVWYQDSGDVVTGNIWMAAHRPALMKHWGKEIDRNLFVAAQHRDAFRAQGCDTHSLVGDPMFVDPARGDYRVQPGSPALTLGFKNFPMDRFGVQKASLKAIARTPAFPAPRIAIAARKNKRVAPVAWLGTRLQELRGEEFSAFGVAKEEGGVHLLTVAPKSGASRAGLQAGDVIQSVNGRPVRNPAEFLRAVGSLPPGENASLKVVRGQRARRIEFSPSAR